MSSKRKVLIAGHSRGQARRSFFLEMLLEHIEQRHPDLWQRIIVWRTGTPMPPLEGVAAGIFMLADPISLYPDCEREALALAGALRERGARIFNPPEALNNTAKARQAEIWQRAGIPCAGAEVAADEAEVRQILKRIRYPIILRYDLGHVQESASVCASEDEAIGRLGELRYPATILEFVDTRPSWRAVDPEHLMALYFHKKRGMAWLGRACNHHIYFSDNPLVAQRVSTAKAAHMGEPILRIEEMVAADVDFAFAPPEHGELMLEATEALGLDIAAIDYSSLGDGSIILWEANPYFHWPPPGQGALPRRRRSEERLVRFLEFCTARIEEVVPAGEMR